MGAPRRMSITNLETGETLDVQYNPTSVDVKLEAAYNRVASPGASFAEMQFTNTGNTKVTFDLPFDGLAPDSPDLDAVQGFLFALLYPPQDPLGAKNGSPPRILFRWPGWIALTTRLPTLTTNQKRFAADGAPTYIVVKVELEESRTTRLGTEGVRRSVLRRSA